MGPMLARTTRISPAVLAMVAGSALGGPEGERVVAGQAAFDRAGSATTITAGNNAIIEYRSFDIGANESVRFVQPSADARVLNRVLGTSPTQIAGSLTANGQVYIVNEAGVYFGSTAVVDAGAIFAAAGTITNADFLGGIDRFTGIAGEVRNEGVMRAGEVHLAGRRVTNLGDIAGDDGMVTMTAGDEVLIGRRDGHVFVRAEGLGSEANAGGVDQAGSITAGRVRLGSGDLFSVALRPTSRITASEVRIEGEGRGTVHVRGSIDASSGDGVGGSVGITGEGLAVLDADINASGLLGGGEILIGGGYRGDTSVIGTADRVYVSDQAMLRADAIRSGNGGTVVTWADGAAIFEGNVSVRGGSLLGDGGRAEVSSPNFISVGGTIDAAAPNGKRGSLLIDPENISITDQPGSPANSLLDDNQIPIDEAPGLSVVITSDRLETIGDVDVLLEAAQNILIGEIGDSSLDLPQTAGQTVTMFAGNEIRVAEGTAITTQGGSLNIIGDQRVNVDSINANGGTIRLVSDELIDSMGTVRSDGGIVSFTVRGGDRTANIANAEARFFGFDLDRIKLSGNLIGQTNLDLTGVTTFAVTDAGTGATIGAVNGADTFDLTFDPSVAFEGPGGLRFIGRSVMLPAINGLSRLEVTATDSLTLTGDIQMNNDADGLGGTIDLREAGTIVLASPIRLDTDLPGSAEAGAVLLNGAAIDGAGLAMTIDTNNDSGEGFGTISLGDATLDSLTLFGGPVDLNGALSVSQTLGFGRVESVLVAGDASIATNGANLSFTDLDVNGPGSLAIDLTGTGAPGLLDLDGAIGNTDPLASLSITGGPFALREVTTLGDQTYTSSSLVRLDGDLESGSGGTIQFNGGVFFDDDRTITTGGGANDHVEFLGNVTGLNALLTTVTGRGSAVFDQLVSVQSLTTLGSTELRGATISAEELVQLGEDVARDSIELTQGSSLVRSRTSDVIFRGDIQGGQTLRVAVDPTITGNNIPVIWFEDSIGDQTAVGSIVIGDPDAAFFGGTRTDVPAVATAVFARFDDDGNPVSGLSFEVETTGDFVMNPLEKLTALGDLSVTSGGTARIGDMNTTDNLTITAPGILINTRAAADLVAINDTIDPPALRPETATPDNGVDFVVGGAAAFNGVVSVTDASLPQPTIAEPAGQFRVEGILTRAPQEAVTAEDLAFNRRTGAGPTLDRTTVLDARAIGAVTVPLAESLTPESVERSQVAQQNAELAVPNVPEAQASTNAAGVGVREPTREEYLSSTRGVAFYIDMPEQLAGSPDLSVVSARLSPGDADAFTGAWAQLASAVNEPASEPERVLGRIRSTLTIAAEQYRAQSGESINDADAFELFTTIRNSQADSSRGLVLVGEVLGSVRGLGLSERETSRIEAAILDGIRPPSLERETVRSLVESAIGAR